MQNAPAIYAVLRRLFIQRQSKLEKTNEDQVHRGKAAAPVADSNHVVQQLKQYKELLDMGVITEEQFEKKREQLLGQ